MTRKSALVSTMEVGLFTIAGGQPRRQRSPGRQNDASEVEFLRREVFDLERVIKTLHASRTSDSQDRAQLERRTHAALEESAKKHAAALRELDGARAELFRMREEHSYAISSASAGEAETRVLACELRLLALELLDAEAEREAAREAEASALSIARTYRRFAAQGASRLDEMRVGIEEVQVRLQRRVEELQMASREVLRLRALRAVHGWSVARGLNRAFMSWRFIVFSAEQREAVALRLEAAYRQRDIEAAATRVQAASERRQARELTCAAKTRLESEQREAALIKERAVASAAADAERRALAEKRAATLASQLEDSRQTVARVKQAGAADLAACREELSAARHDTARAREAERAAAAQAAQAQAQLESFRMQLAQARSEAKEATEARLEESKTRAFLERVLREERAHASRRATEATLLVEALEELGVTHEDLDEISARLGGAIFELNSSLLGRALRGGRE